MKWIIGVLVIGGVAAGLYWWSTEQAKHQAQLNRQQEQTRGADARAYQEKKAARCKPIEGAEAIIKASGRTDLIRKNADFCNVIRAGECSVIVEVREELLKANRTDLADAVAEMGKCPAAVLFASTYGMDAYRAHMKLAEEEIENALDEHCEDHVRQQREAEDFLRHDVGR